MITKLDIMLDPESYDGSYTGDVKKVAISDASVQFIVDFDFNGKSEEIVAEISLTKGLNRSTKMLRDCGIKKIDELKNVKQISFNIASGWVNITGLGDQVASANSTSADTSKFLK